MKKQFFRVKQLADQTFLKAEKSEVLNHEELQIADQRVETLRSAFVAVNKKICPNGPLSDKEKRLKKCLEYQIGSTFVEEARDERDCILLQNVLRLSGLTEQDLARDYADHEAKVEEMVYSPIQKVIENELPSIAKQKHSLKKYCLDKDSASNRYHSTKKETLKEDMEEADTKVEQSRDALAIEMFNLLARENEFSSYILQLLKLQRGYHESALKSLETIIPRLEKTIGDSSIKKVYGVPLAEHLRVTGKKLAYPLEICITTLSEFGLSEEGLFRIAGGLSKVKRLKAAIDSGCFSSLIPEYRDVHVLASTLKSYLRELPEPLLTYGLHKDWMQSMQYPENQRVEVVKHLLNKLPQENRDNLAYLIQFLSRLAYHTENKMSSSNIAIVMAPNLLWNRNEEVNVNMGNCVTINMLVELFINEVDTFFPEDVSRYVTITSLMPDEEVTKPTVNNGRSPLIETSHLTTSTESLLDSPKPNTRKKKPAAPVPPPNAHAAHPDEHERMTNSYPSGNSTLTRPPKPKDPPRVKTTVGVNTEENDLSLSRKKSFSKDDLKLIVIAQPPPPVAPPSVTVNNCAVSDASATKVVTQAQTSMAKAQPVIRPVAMTADGDERSFKTTATHHVGVSSAEGNNSSQKPVAAPRQSLLSDSTSDRTTKVARTSSLRSASTSNDVTARSHNCLEFGDVQLRRPEADSRSKPEIPARPATLIPNKRSSMDIDPTLHKTQCSVYSVANKQQPSIVHFPNRTEKIQLGHDVMMAEKEKFLGHAPTPRTSLENKFNINSNKDKSTTTRPSSTEEQKVTKPCVPPKSLALGKSSDRLNSTKSSEQLYEPNDQQQPSVVSKSSEKLNEINDNNRRKTSHARTRSDGNLIDLDRQRGGDFLVHTPPSPRSLNKPTEPPPPPPVQVKRPEPESTDF